jgi:type I restriction enzyme S subunit
MTVPTVKIGDLVDQVRGVTYSSGDAVAAPKDGYVELLRANNIDGGKLNFSGVIYVPKSKVSEKQFLKQNDIVIAASSGSLNLVGKAGSFNANRVSTFGAFCKVLRPNNKVDARYIANYFQTSLYRKTISSLAEGANINNLRNEHIENLEIKLPPIAEQKRIAVILDKAEEIRYKREQAITKLDQLAQSIFVEMFGDTKSNNKNFPIKTLGELIDFQGGSQPPASSFTHEEAEDNIRLVQIRDFRTDKFKTYIPKKLAKRFFDIDDVMVGRYGPPVFQIFRGLSGSYNVALMKAAPKSEVTKDFIFYLLQEKYLHNFVVANSERTAGQSGVNLELLEKYKAYLPPIDLQEKHSLAVKAIEKQKIILNEAHSRELKLLSSLQHQAFATGFDA